ncbi:hypothetical protein C7M84_003740 [Penaeus vannamei]|uniref:Histone-lysine N-methyltransferase trithorax n=1 Tax=Penaeus vannamei TaxID=6689 RepID=A0A423TMB5_PENVA|nr:hypothetical protein C7M84_003740 [Penaeus vannamei]
MMECGRCGEWIHAHCEGLNNERYQILSFLPDTVEYVCRSCVTESTSTWLHAVSSELMAGCEAVLQALIASRCAKHLVKREASSKVSSSGGLTPLPCLPEVGTSIQARIDDALVERVEGLDSLLPATNTNTVAVESHSTTTSAESNTGEVSPLSGSNVCVSITTVAAGDSYVSSTLEGTSSSSDTSHIVGSVDDLGVGAPQTSSKSDDCAVDTNKNFSASLCSVIVNRTDIPQEGAGESSKLSGDQTACFSDNQSENVAANKSTGKSGCITVAKDKSDLKGKSSKEKNADESKAISRRQTRSSSGGVALLGSAGSIGNAADPIKLKECSVRLEDICKARSPSSSPIKTQQSEMENVPVVEDKKTEETSKSQETIVEDTLIKDSDERTTESLESLEEKELERETRDTLQGILALKDTDVSCTQVDGPNDETTATARVIRNLFFEDRSQMMLDTTSLLESKTKVDEKNLAHVEAQLISPKDKITKDIDDDCVSSEESSYCDTDTEIESIQDDPEEPRDLLSVKEKLRERKYDSVLQFHVDMVRVIENGRHLNRSQTRNVQVTYTKHMKECFPWFDIKTANVFELVDKQRPFPLPHWDHSYVYRPMLSGTRIFSVRDVPLYRKRSTSPLKGAQASPPDRRKCVLCGREGDDEPNAAGRLLYLGQDEWMHVNCGLWSSEVYEEVDGGLQNIYLAVSRGRLIKCSACNERGATVGCCHKSCQATYHFLCARKACCQFMEDKRIFCPLHESTSNGEEKTDDFKVSRCVYVDMDSEKKKWKQVAGNRVSIIIGSLTIKNVGRIVPESDSAEALIPLDFLCSRVYWSTVDPSKKVTYTCRTKRVVPAFDDSTLVGDAAFHRTIDHSLGEEAVSKEMAAVRKWFKQLEERKVEKKSRETNIIPPHLCPLYRSIREREQETRVVEKIVRCRTPPAIVELDVRQCIDDIIDRVSRSVEEESLLLDTDLPAIVSADDNELISMVLNDLDACDSITLQSTPSTSGRPSPLDIDFLSTCDHMMDSGKVSHSGNLTQEAQETECDPQGIMDAASLSPRLHPTLAAGIDPIHETYRVESPNADVKEPIIETIAPPSMQDLGSVPSSSTKSLQNTCNSSQNIRRSSSASEHSDAIGHAGHNHSPPAANQSPRNSDENEGNSTAGRGSERKKICMKRNYKTVIKKYPLRSGMRKSKPYETVQIEINETIEIPGGEGSGMVRKSLKRKWSGILDSEEEEDNNQKETGIDQEGQEETTNRSSDGENSKENSVSKKVLKFSDDNNDITVSIVNNNNLCEFSKSRVHKYRHKTVLQLDGAADGSSSSAEMSESQDEGTGEERRRLQEQEDPQTPPLHSALAMRIKEQSLARSSPGEEGPYKCGKCKRLYRTKESYQKHIETCTFEVDSSSTSEDEEYEEVHIEEEEEGTSSTLPHLQEEKIDDVIQENLHMPSLSEREEYPSISQHNVHVPLLSEDSVMPNTSANQPSDIDVSAQSVDDTKPSVVVDLEGHARPSGEEPAVKRARLDVTLPRLHGVHRQVRTAIKKCQSTSEDVELLQVVRGPPPPGSDVFVPPPVSPVKFSPVVKKSASPRRYTNVRLLRGSRGYQYRRAAPHLPGPHEHYQGTNSGVQMTPSAAPAPIQVAMHPMTNNSGQNLAQGALAAFQQFPGQSSQYAGTPQLTSPVTHLTSAVQVTPQVTSQVAPQVSPQVSPQVLTMVSAPSVAVPQGYTLQYVGSFRDGEVAAGGGGLVTYPAAPVVVPQPQLVMTPQQSSVVVPQVVNTNITYTFTAPETLVINQPAMVPGMQSVQYLPQQQQQQQQQPQVIHHPEQQVGAVMQYNQTGVSPQQVPVSHMHTGQVHTPCMPYSDIQASPICMQPHAQTAIVTRELSFTGGGSKPLQSAPCIGSSQNRSSHGVAVSLPVTSTCSGPIARHRPQASVAPQVIQPQPTLTTSSSDVNLIESQGHSRLPFSDRPLTGVVRTVATVAPAIITTTTMVSLSTCSSATRLTSMDTSPKVATVRPRPTYSYRDAMREKQLERQKQRQEVLQLDRMNISDTHHDFLKEREGLDVNISDSETDSETETTSHDAEKEKEDHLETQSYKLVLRKDSSASTGFNVLPISGPTTPLPSPEVKELRIKAKVSVGPKRKKAKSRDPEKDLIIVNKDTSSDLYVNEQLPNFSVNPMHNPADDPAMFDKPKACSAEPYIVFELTSEDGFRVESRHIAEVWQKVFDAVAAARASMRMDPKVPHNIQQPSSPGDSISGLHMLGLTHNAVQYLLEQLPGAKDCHKYSFQFHRRPQEEGAVEENPTGCARTEPFKTRSPYDIFSWLASKHRRMPERSLVQQEEIQLSTTRRATSLELPMAMRYRHLRETAREAVGVFRSSIHGRGLFCKRDIDAGEMVIEYAGQVIRSSLCDMREKDYESKGIGCYMFRIDDDTVIDATMHGNAARFINHSCDPNCYSRVVDILGKKHIIIFALRRILRGEELTYDYKFPIEEDKIPCTCGTRRCRKYLN